MTFAFEADTAVEARGPGVYAANITDRWSIGGRPNGGYLMGIVLNALAHRLPHPDPLTTTGHFVAPAEVGAGEVEVTVIKQGRNLSTAQAVLRQAGRDRLVVLSTFGDLGLGKGPIKVEPAPVHGDDLVSSKGRPFPFPIVDRFVFELPPDQARAAAGGPD
ncbi:MAG: thioesterase family protein, partial [Acidimicrobiia bacterium]